MIVSKAERQAINNLLQTDNAFLHCVLTSLYDRQESNEKRQRKTLYKNGVGFSTADAATFSEFARDIKKRGYLTTKQLQACRKPFKRGGPRIGKYWRQIITFPACSGNWMNREYIGAYETTRGRAA